MAYSILVLLVFQDPRLWLNQDFYGFLQPQKQNKELAAGHGEKLQHWKVGHPFPGETHTVGFFGKLQLMPGIPAFARSFGSLSAGYWLNLMMKEVSFC